MADQIQCNNCGAILLAEDVFCGECGAPRPSPTEAVEVPEAEIPAAGAEPTPSVIPPTSPDTQPSSSANTGWRVAFFVLVILGAIACCAALVTFLLFGSTPSETTTPQEDWLYAALCCLLPFGGTGIILAGVGGIVWYTQIRKR